MVIVSCSAFPHPLGRLGQLFSSFVNNAVIGCSSSEEATMERLALPLQVSPLFISMTTDRIRSLLSHLIEICLFSIHGINALLCGDLILCGRNIINGISKKTKAFSFSV